MFSTYTQGWKFALRSFALDALLNRAMGANHSCCSLLKEWFTLVGLYKKSDGSDKLRVKRAICSSLLFSLSLLFTKRVKRVICSFKKSTQAIHFLLSTNKGLAQKTKERIPNPAYTSCLLFRLQNGGKKIYKKLDILECTFELEEPKLNKFDCRVS